MPPRQRENDFTSFKINNIQLIILSICTYVWHVFVYIIVSQSMHEHGLLNFDKYLLNLCFIENILSFWHIKLKYYRNLKKNYYRRPSV